MNKIEKIDGRKNNGGSGRGAGRHKMPEEEKKIRKTLKVAPDVWFGIVDLSKLSKKSQAVVIENLVRKAIKNPKLID